MVELVAAGRRPKELTTEFGCHETSISTWVRQACAATPTLASLSPILHESERAELVALRKEVRQLKVERDILSNGFANQRRADVRTLYTLIAANQAELPVARLCDTLGVSKSGDHDWHESAPSARVEADHTLVEQIQAAHAMRDETYGMPRIRAVLADEGIHTSRKRINRLMRTHKLRGVSRRRGYTVTTVGDAYDNAMAERLEATLECELIDRRVWRTHVEARLAIFTWIESWYNPKRRHSSLGKSVRLNLSAVMGQP